jgi:TIR domain
MMYPNVARSGEAVMAGKIFINYRRDDAIGTAGRLHDRLAQTFGRDNLFMDVDHIPVGADFVEYLHSQVAACDVFLAVIGPNWLNAKDNRGRRRFDNPDDYVTIEIAAALARNIPVIPVLVDNARMPNADKLPDSVKPLVRRNAFEIRNTQFGRDAEALANKVRELLEGARPVRKQWPFLAWLMVPSRWRMVAGTAMPLLLVGWIGLYQIGAPVWVPWAPDPPRADKAKAVADAEAQRKAIEAELQRIKDEVERQAKAAADAEAKRRAAEAEQQRLKDEEQRQAKAEADAEAKRKAAEAEQQRLAAIKEEQQREAQAAADAEAKRKAAEVEQQRLATAKAEEERKAKAAAEAEAKRKSEEAEQQRQATAKAEEERRKQAAPGGVSKFDGNWLVHRGRCAGRPELNFQVHLENGKISGRFEPKEISAVRGSRPPIIGSISASGGINFNHHRVNNAGEIEHANAYYRGTFRGNSASGTFSTGYCNGTFTMART